jgi:hypothetical protein
MEDKYSCEGIRLGGFAIATSEWEVTGRTPEPCQSNVPFADPKSKDPFGRAPTPTKTASVVASLMV